MIGDKNLSALVKRNVELEAAWLDNRYLREENEQLKVRLDALHKSHHLPNSLPSPAILGTASPREIDELDSLLERSRPRVGGAEAAANKSIDPFFDAMENLSKHYCDVKKQNDCYKTAYNRVTAKYREQLSKWKKWQKHYEKVGGQSPVRKPADCEATVTREVSTKDDTMSGSSLTSIPPPQHSTGPKSGGQTEQSAAQPSCSQDASTSTQDTEDETTPKHQVTEITRLVEVTDDDTPVIVSERSLKRKRPNSTHDPNSKDFLSGARGSTNAPLRIKEESPEMDQHPNIDRRLERCDTFDLEGLGSRIVTPKKRQRYHMLLERTQRESFKQRALGELRQERSASEPTSAMAESHPFLHAQQPVAIDFAADAGQVDKENQDETANQRLTHVPTLAAKGKHLHQPGLNAPSSVQKPAASLLRKGSSSFCERDAYAVSLMTEDGEDTPAIGNSRRRNATSPVKKLQKAHKSSSDTVDEKHGRLQALLESSSPARIRLSPRKADPPEGRISAEAHRSDEQLTNVHVHGSEERVPKVKQEVTQMLVEPVERRAHYCQRKDRIENTIPRENLVRKDAQKRQSSPTQTKTRLRLLPTSALKLSDFKPNPAVNQGLDFAFNEVVRNRDAKRCLPGCTDPNCCGATFRRLAEMGGLPELELPRGLWDSSPREDEDPDTRLLSAYLGIPIDAVNELSDERRKEELIAARVELFANQTSKHRRQWRRARSPPGYWNVDFPGTQTQMRDNLEAERRERERIEERAREARRERGRWLFRDEA